MKKSVVNLYEAKNPVCSWCDRFEMNSISVNKQHVPRYPDVTDDVMVNKQ